MGSFAVGIGAMISGIFGMNMKNCMENSIIGFYGTTLLLCLGCVGIFFGILQLCC